MATVTRMPTRNYDSGFQPTQPKELAAAAFGWTGLDAQKAITAGAGGLAAAAALLIGGLNQVTVVATANDGLKLPKAVPGTVVFVAQIDSADDAVLFSNEGASVTIDGTSGATGITLTHGKNYLLFCTSATTWNSMKGA